MDWEAVIGLETHVQLATATKLFCACRHTFGEPPNRHTCPVCAGLPGALPVLNAAAWRAAVRAALALGATIAAHSRFARKNYFYPDLPKGYQISQYDQPFATGGHLDLRGGGLSRRVRLERIHLEEDAGKILHVPEEGKSLVDLNRAGVPLLEIVTRPDLRTPEEAGACLRLLRATMRALGVSDGDMEKGSLRCDANCSLRPRGSPALGTKVEIKNLNSFRMVQRALRSEIERQRGIRDRGGRIESETRRWREEAGTTERMRSKEVAMDYRYFPEPDLPPLRADPAWVEELRATLPETPTARFERYRREACLPEPDAWHLAEDPVLARLFERTLASGALARTAANWILGPVLHEAAARGADAGDLDLPPARLAALLRLAEEGSLSATAAKTVLHAMLDTGRAPRELMRDLGLEQISDEAALLPIVRRAIEARAGAARQVRDGKAKALEAILGEVMRLSRGQANPTRARELLRRELGAPGDP